MPDAFEKAESSEDMKWRLMVKYVQTRVVSWISSRNKMKTTKTYKVHETPN